MSFDQQFDLHGAWCREHALRLKGLGEWLKDQELLDAAVQERLQRLDAQLRQGKLMVAFAAEFSRGKSELINAVFFSGYGQRIVPASAGRTTMCPTELSYEAGEPACLRLLPIESRLAPQTLAEWRQMPQRWNRVELDVADAPRLAAALQQVAETRRVDLDQARALGFWHDDSPQDNPLPDAEGCVEVPRWRHALVNLPHPLLRQGLVVLDTPGLNAVGAEPELTLGLLPQAHAVVFILAADAGVSRTDLEVWREHLPEVGADPASRLVVLNKVDTLWDALSAPAQVQAQIERQRAACAETLGVAPQQVIPVSAQKGLLAKVRGDAELLRASGLPQLEQALGEGLLARRQQVLAAALAAGVRGLRAEAARVLHVRRRALAEQTLELRGLRGKNTAVIRQMRQRVEQERLEFDRSATRVHAMRSVHLKLLQQVFQQLGTATLKAELAELGAALRQGGFKLGLNKAYGLAFERLRASLTQAQDLILDIQAMLEASCRQINAEHGFSVQMSDPPDLSPLLADLDQVAQSYRQYLGVGNVLRLSRADFSDRLARALMGRVRAIFEAALADVERWSKAFASQLDVQLRDRRRDFGRRIEAIARIEQAADGLEQRLSELEAQEAALDAVQVRLDALTAPMLAAGAAAPAEQALP
ncbi:dynamin family protein [Ramlibacter sp. 2FC]|uniref:dynamin family protein n=1 Tax=Ramlibacter sp. 2FC TaxID=2502188 RepID=UPI0010F99F13|nr:dynamin family protein [Ramlibacter sp. 2FC]